MSTPHAELPPVEIRRLGSVTVATLLDKRVLGARATALFEDHLMPEADALAGDVLVPEWDGTSCAKRLPSAWLCWTL